MKGILQAYYWRIILGIFLIPTCALAITQKRIADINQFIADLKAKRITNVAQIESRQKQLKAGLSSRELQSRQIKDMDKQVQATISALTPPKVPGRPAEAKALSLIAVAESARLFKETLENLFKLKNITVTQNDIQELSTRLNDLKNNLSLYSRDQKNTADYKNAQKNINSCENLINNFKKRIGKKPVVAVEEEESLADAFKELFGEEIPEVEQPKIEEPEVIQPEEKAPKIEEAELEVPAKEKPVQPLPQPPKPPVPAKPKPKEIIIILATPENTAAIQIFKDITGQDVTNKRIEVAEKLVTEFEQKNKRQLDIAQSKGAQPTAESQRIYDQFNSLNEALDILRGKQVPIPTVEEGKKEPEKAQLVEEGKKPAEKKPQLVDIIKPLLDPIEKDINVIYSNLGKKKKPTQKQIDDLVIRLGEVQETYIRSGQEDADLAKRIRNAYKGVSGAELTIKGTIKELGKEKMQELLAKENDADLWEALEKGKINSAQYEKAIKARIHLIAAAKEPDSACVNLKLVDRWTVDLGVYINDLDKQNMAEIRRLCPIYEEKIEKIEEEKKQLVIQKETDAYKLYIAPLEKALEKNPVLVQALYDETSAFLNDLKTAKDSLTTDNIKSLNFKQRYNNLRKFIQENAKTDAERKRCQIAILDPIAKDIKKFIVSSIKAHRKQTNLEELHKAIQGEVGASVKALEFIWKFEVEVDGTKIPMIEQIQSMNNALQELGLAFTDQTAGDDVEAIKIEEELFITFAYLLAPFDAFCKKILTAQQGYFAWIGSWVAYMMYSFLSQNRAPNPWSGAGYAKTYMDLINKVGQSIVNGIKIYDRVLLRPILGPKTVETKKGKKKSYSGSVSYIAYDDGLWYIKHDVPNFRQNPTNPSSPYIYAAIIEEIAIPGSNSIIELEPKIVIDGRHNKKPKDYDILLIELKELVNKSLGQVEAKKQNEADKELKKLVNSIEKLRQASLAQKVPLSKQEANVAAAIESYKAKLPPQPSK